MTAYLVLTAVVAALSFGAGWTVNGWREDAAKLAAKQAVEESREKFDQWSEKRFGALEDRLSNLRIINRTINKEVEREIRKEPVFLDPDCGLPGAYRLLNNARAGRADEAAGKRDAAMPAAPAVPAGAVDGKNAPR